MNLKSLFATVVLAVFGFCAPALAQHQGHASGGHNAGGGNHGFGGGEQRGQAHNNVARPAQGQAHGERGGFREGDRHEGYHYGVGDIHGGAREHFRDGRFEDHFFRQHWGADHHFYWGRCNWWGPRFYPGSYFWYSGAYFVIIDEVPDYWYGDDTEVIVIYDDGYYWLVNPLYPGVRFHVNVRF